MHKEGKTIIVATHDVSSYLDIATKIVELDEGRIIHQAVVEDWSKMKKISIPRQKRKREINKNTKDVILSTENLNFSFKDGFRLENLSFSIFKGEIVGIIGDNGSGKTTLAKLLCGLLKPNSGKILIKDKELDELEAKIKRSLSIIAIQGPNAKS